MNYFMREVSKEINRRAGRINHNFGGGYKASIIDSPYHYANVLRYIYQNPLRVGICNRVEDYPYTTLQTLFGQDKHPLPIYPSLFDRHSPITNDTEKALSWLNRLIDTPTSQAMAAGLRKTIFGLPSNQKLKEPIVFTRENETEVEEILNLI